MFLGINDQHDSSIYQHNSKYGQQKIMDSYITICYKNKNKTYMSMLKLV